MGDLAQVTFEVLVPREAAERWAQVIERVEEHLFWVIFWTLFAFIAVRIIDKVAECSKD